MGINSLALIMLQNISELRSANSAPVRSSALPQCTTETYSTECSPISSPSQTQSSAGSCPESPMECTTCLSPCKMSNIPRSSPITCPLSLSNGLSLSRTLSSISSLNYTYPSIGVFYVLKFTVFHIFPHKAFYQIFFSNQIRTLPVFHSFL